MTRIRAAHPTFRSTVVRRRLALSSALGATLVVAAPAWSQNGAKGQFGTVTDTTTNGVLLLGDPSINLVNANRLDVTLNSRATVIDWSSFNVKDGATANFSAPSINPTAVVLNRVTVADAANTTTLAGTINAADVEVWVSNPNGIVMGSSGNFNTQGFVATTLNITPGNFVAGGNRRFAQLAGADADAGITGSAGAIATNGGLLALVAPRIQLSGGAYNSGTGPTVFALATDVTVNSSPGSPLSLTLNAGTALNSTVGGTIVGDRVYALLRPQDTKNALLSVTATVINATVNARGVVVLSGPQLSAEVPVGGNNTDELSTGGALNGAGTLGRAEVATINFQTPRGNPAATPTAGLVNLRATGAVTAGAVSAAGNLTVASTTGQAAVTGAVAVGGNYAVSGASVALGNAAGTDVNQAADGSVTLTSLNGGAITGRSGLTLTVNSDNTTGNGAEAMTFNPGSGGRIAFGDTTINGGTGRQSAVYVSDTDVPVTLGAVNARVLRATTTNPIIVRTLDVTLGAVNLVDLLRIEANNITTGSISVTGTGQAAQLFTSGTPIIVNGAINAAGAISVVADGGAVTTGALTSGRTVEVTSAVTNNGVESGGAVTTGAIRAGGDVMLRGRTLTTGAIGTTATPIGGGVTAGTIAANLTAPAIVANGAVALTAGAGYDLILPANIRSVTNQLQLTGDRVLVGAATGNTALRALTGLTVTARTGDLLANGAGTASFAAEGNAASITLVADRINLPGASLTAGTAAQRGAITVQSSAATLGDVVLGDVFGASLRQRVGAGGTPADGLSAGNITLGDFDLTNALLLTSDGGTGVTVGDGTVRGAGQGITISAPSSAAGQTTSVTAGTIAAADGDLSIDTSGLITVSGASGVDVALRSRASDVVTRMIAARDDIAVRAAGAIREGGGGARSWTAGTTVLGNAAIDRAGAADTLNGATLEGRDVTASGTSIGLTSVTATGTGSDVALTASAGALTFGSLGAGGAATLVKQGTTDTLSTTGALNAGSLDASSTTAIQLANVTTTGGGIALTAATGIAAGTLDAAGTVTLAGTADGGAAATIGSVLTTGDAVAGTAAVRLASLQLTGPSTVDGSFTAVTTGTTALGTLRATGSLAATTATGDISFAALSGGGAKTLTAGGAVTGTSIAGAGAVDVEAGGTGTLSIGGIAEQVASLTINGGTAATIAGPVSVAGATSIGQAASGAATGTVTFTGTLTTGSLASQTAGAASFARVAAANGTGASVTSGSVDVRSTGGGAISFAGPVDGGGALTIDTAGLTSFGGAVGANAAFTSLTTTGTGAVAINGGGVRTTGTQDYGGVVRLGAATVLAGSGASFAAGVDGGPAFNDLTLRFSGDSAIGGDALANIGSLVVDGGGTTTLNGNVTTRGSQTWSDPLVLGAAATLTSTNGGAIGFAALSGANALTVNTAGTTTFAAGATDLASITTDAAGTSVLNGTLATSGAQSYGDAVLLGGATVVTSAAMAGDAVTFAGTVNGAQALTITTAGRTSFEGAIGSATALTALTVDGGGTTLLSGGAVRTTGAQTYADRLALGANTVLTGGSGSFAGGVTGNGFDLRLEFAGSTAIDPGITGVNNLDVVGAATIGGIIDTAGGQRYRGPVTLVDATSLRSGGGGGTGAITLDGTVDGLTDGGQALAITTGGTTRLGGIVGGAFRLASIAVDGTGGVVFAGGVPMGGRTVATTGAQSYAGAATLAADAKLSAAAGSIGFGGAVDGARLLSVEAGGGAATFAGRLGGGTALTGLAVRAGTVALSATANRVGTIAAAISAGGLNFDDAAALSVGTVDGLSGITAASGIAAGSGITLSAAGRLTLAADVTGAANLTAAGIVQNAGTAINAGPGTIMLDGNGGAIVLNGALGTTNASVDALRIVDASGLLLGQVGAANGTVTLGGAGADAIAGAVTQAAGTGIAAATLTGNASGAVTLANAGNAVGTLAAFNAAEFRLATGNGLIVTGPVVAGTGDIALTLAGGALALNGLVSAANGAVALTNAGGAISQSTGAGSAIVAGRLTGSAVGGASLQSAANAINQLDGFTVSGGGGLALVDSVALRITGDVDGGESLDLSASGLDFTGRLLRASGNVTLSGGAGSVVGASAIAGGDLSLAGLGIDVATASAGSGAAGVLRANAASGLLRLGTGFAGERISLVGGGDVAVTTGLIAGTSGNTGSVSTIEVVAGGTAAIAQAGSNNGGVSITGASANVGMADATGGALLVRATRGALSLGSGTAATTATLDATGPDGRIDVTGALVAGTDVTAAATGEVRVATVDAGRGLTLRSDAGGVTFGALTGAAAKTVMAATSIGGGSIGGVGGVTLTAGPAGTAANTITVAQIGADGAVASLSVNGGSQTTLGTAGGTVNVAGGLRVGQAPGASTGALLINGALTTASLAATVTGDVRLGDVLLADTGSTVTAGGGISAGAVTLSGNGTRSLVLTGDAGVTTGAIANVGGAVGTVVIDAGAGSGEARVASSDLADRLSIAGGRGGVTVGALTGAGDKSITSAGAIRGTGAGGAGATIDGGAVTLIGGAASAAGNTIQLDAIGAGTRVASLAINGGSAVTIGAAGASGTAVRATGSVAIGLPANGPATGTVMINGAVDAAGGLAIVAGGPVTIGAIASGDAVGLQSDGALSVGALTGAGSKTLTARGAVTAASIDGGIVRVRGGTVDPIRLGAVGAAAPTASLTINGGNAVTISGPVTVSGVVAIGQGAGPGDGSGALEIAGPVAAASFASTSAGATRLATLTSDGSVAITATGSGGDVRFDALAGQGDKRIAAAGGIAGGAISGTGAVLLNPGAVGAVTIASVGNAAARASSLSVVRGGAVQIGPVFTSGAAAFGQADAIGALTLGDAVVGSLDARTAGATRFASVTSPGTIAVTASGGDSDIVFTDLGGMGDKRLTAGRSITGAGPDGTGASIDGGVVALTAGPAGAIVLDSLGARAAATSVSINAGSAVTLGRQGNTDAALVTLGATDIGQASPVAALTINGTATTGSLTANAAGAAVLTGGVTAAGGPIAIRAGSVQARTLDAGGAVTVTSAGDATLIGGTSGGDFAIAALGAARISGTVGAGGGYRVRGTSVSLGSGATMQSARGVIDLVATGGGLTGSDGLVLTSNSDGTGADYLSVDASGAIQLGGTTLAGGTAADASDVSVVQRAPGATVTLGKVVGRQLGSFDAARTGIGTLVTSGAVTFAGPVDVQRGLGIATSGGPISVGEVRVSDAGGGITLTSSAPNGGAITARLLSAGANGLIGVDARGAASVTTATGGATEIRGATVQVGTATARGSLRLGSTAGGVTLGTADASGPATLVATGGDVDVTTRLASGGAATVTATGATRLARVAAATGDLAVTAGVAVSGTGAGRADLAATTGGVRVQSGGAALLGPVTAAGTVAVQATAIDISSATAAAGGLTLSATAGNIILGTAQAGGDAGFDATGMVTLGAVTAGSGAGISVRGLDATLNGALRAGRVAFVNRAPGLTTLRLGNGTAAGGFQLSQTEINQVEAGALTFDGGTGNVEFGAMAFGANAGRTTVDVLSTGRIDVRDAVTASGAGRTFRLGGTAGSTDTKASVINLVATPAGGGKLLLDTANLDLRGTRIGAGQSLGFLDALGLSAGGTPIPAGTAGQLYVGNANSALYNATFGGGFYNPSGGTYLSASTLTVRYAEFALFQNTGVPGVNAGVALGSATAPVANALVLQGPGASAINSFALFGTINGIGGTPTAVLGPTAIGINNVALATTRINGCIIGSGAGCLTSVVSQPVLNVFDASRLDVFRAADDFALPFDPVIGTNNEALFSGISLADVPVTSTECAGNTDTPECRRSQETPK